MRALALAVCQAKPILLQGLTGAGKTALIEHLAYVTNNLGTTYDI
jgi:MoxR-like ATPase